MSDQLTALYFRCIDWVRQASDQEIACWRCLSVVIPLLAVAWVVQKWENWRAEHAEEYREEDP